MAGLVDHLKDFAPDLLAGKLGAISIPGAFSMRRLHVLRAVMPFCLSLFVLTGCGGKADLQSKRIAKVTGSAPVKVVPIAGVILIDGQPERDVHIKLNKRDGTVVSETTTQEKGRFAFSTYNANDGVPAGEYRVTFEWREPGSKRKGKREFGPDKLNEQYSDPKKSEFQLTVVEGTPQKSLEYKLTLAK